MLNVVEVAAKNRFQCKLELEKQIIASLINIHDAYGYCTPLSH